MRPKVVRFILSKELPPTCQSNANKTQLIVTQLIGVFE